MVKAVKIPFLPVPLREARKSIHTLIGAGGRLSDLVPSLGFNLKQADIDISPREYAAIVVFSAIFYGLMFTFLFLFFGILLKNKMFMGLSPMVGLLGAFMITFYQLSYPRVLLAQKVANVERNLIFAAKNLLVQVYAGIPLFDAVTNIANADFGAVSTEFQKAVKEMKGGKPIEQALEDLAMRNPSIYFRRVVGQLASGIKSGGRLADVLRSIIDYLSSEQMLQVRRYGSVLNPLAMGYMLLAVILPALAVTFMIVLGSFPSIKVGENTFIGLLFIVTVFQIMYLGIMKSKRPNLIGG